jgi:hypothetical protein
MALTSGRKHKKPPLGHNQVGQLIEIRGFSFSIRGAKKRHSFSDANFGGSRAEVDINFSPLLSGRFFPPELRRKMRLNIKGLLLISSSQMDRVACRIECL